MAADVALDRWVRSLEFLMQLEQCYEHCQSHIPSAQWEGVPLAHAADAETVGIITLAVRANDRLGPPLVNDSIGRKKEVIAYVVPPKSLHMVSPDALKRPRLSPSLVDDDLPNQSHWTPQPPRATLPCSPTPEVALAGP